MRPQMKAFDTYTHVNELKKAGFNEEQAAVIIKSLAESRDNDISHLSTKEQVTALEKRVDNCATKEQVTALEKRVDNCATKEQVIKLEASTKEQITELEAKTTTQFHALDKKIEVYMSRLEAKIAETHASTLRWFIGTIIAFSGIIIAGLQILKWKF